MTLQYLWANALKIKRLITVNNGFLPDDTDGNDPDFNNKHRCIFR